jgi:trans-aconitate methyltransferase
MSSNKKARSVCHICGGNGLIPFPVYKKLPRVTSDSCSWPVGGRMVICDHCAGVQKIIDEGWRDEVEKIYSSYAVYKQGGGADQAVFDKDTGTPHRRSDRLVECFSAQGNLQKQGRWLDIGCGNGAMLRSVSKSLPEWKLTGAELDDRNRKIVEEILGVEAFKTGGVESFEGPYDAISMIHVIEHIENPVGYLKELRSLLRLGGALFIEVPYFHDNSFELLIADHCTHFTPGSLRNILEAAGFDVVCSDTSWVRKEITMVAHLSEHVPETTNASLALSTSHISSQYDQLKSHIDWLYGVGGEIREMAANKPFGIFGSANAATFAYQWAEEEVAFFVDEDPARCGRIHLGRPIFPPTSVPDGSVVYISLPQYLAKEIASRWAGGAVKYVVPKDFENYAGSAKN